MQIQIDKMTRSDYGTLHMQISCRKVTAYVGVNQNGGVHVCQLNASHKVWRGAGKFYRSQSEALEKFRSSEMRAIIGAAFDVAQLPQNATIN